MSKDQDNESTGAQTGNQYQAHQVSASRAWVPLCPPEVTAERSDYSVGGDAEYASARAAWPMAWTASTEYADDRLNAFEDVTLPDDAVEANGNIQVIWNIGRACFVKRVPCLVTQNDTFARQGDLGWT